MSAVKSRVLCHSSSVLLCMCGALERKSHHQHICQLLFEQQDIIVIVLCTIQFYI